MCPIRKLHLHTNNPQKLMWNSMEQLRDPLLGCISSAGVQNWRTLLGLDRPESTLKGAINLSPGWFQQGRRVSYPLA